MLQVRLTYQLSSEGNQLGNVICQDEDSFLDYITASIELMKQKQASCIRISLVTNIDTLGDRRQPERTPLHKCHKDSLVTLIIVKRGVGTVGTDPTYPRVSSARLMSPLLY
jgi:hypothetical protein